MDGLPPPPPQGQGQAPSQHEVGPSFQDGVGDALMATEELRQALAKQQSQAAGAHNNKQSSPSEFCFEVRHRLEGLVPILCALQPRLDDPVELDLREHCHSRVSAVALDSLHVVVQTPVVEDSNRHSEDPEFEKAVQEAIARTAELTLALHDRMNGIPSHPKKEEATNQEKLAEIVAIYVGYQRKVIRQRAKPAIKQLVARRQMMKDHTSLAHHAEEEEDDDPSSNNGSSNKSSHTHVMTTILGQASALIHPLILWKSHLPPEFHALNQLCQDSIATVDEQAQTMTKSVANWWMEDRRVDSFWMAQSANEVACNPTEITDLYQVVDEMAFSCQIFDRYMALLGSELKSGAPNDVSPPSSAPTCVLQTLHPEWTWKYASLERYLTTQQLQSALRLAHPVQIVLGTPIQVPSVVEDAQYLSTRALERAASTRSDQAIGTVAHAIASNVWSTDAVDGVHQALLDQQGCYDESRQEAAQAAASATEQDNASKPSSSSFASALLGALDEDLATAPSSSSSPKKKNNSGPPGAPSSGSAFLGLGSLSSLSGGGDRLQRIRMDTFLCALNGIHSASAACSSLVEFLDSLLEEGENQNNENEKSDAMIQLAREELMQYSKNYLLLLDSQVKLVISEFCGSPTDAPIYRGNHFIPVLRYYLEREEYALPSAEELRSAENESRMNQQLIKPMEESSFLQQLAKCDRDVLVAICGEVASRLTHLFLDCITSSIIPKRFTDWGSLLLSKQVRTIQDHLSQLMEKISDDQAIPILPQWEHLSEAVTALQLERPSDWAFYQASSTLSVDQLQKILSRRVDFSDEAVSAVLSNISKS